MIGKKIASICIIIIGTLVAVPFNYLYATDEYQSSILINSPNALLADIIWTIVGIVMIASGFYLLKNSAKLKPI